MRPDKHKNNDNTRGSIHRVQGGPKTLRRIRQEVRAMNRNRLRHIEEYDDDEIWDDRKNATDIWCFD